MIPFINLASHPFRPERAQNVALSFVAGCLGCSLLVLVIMLVHEHAGTADLHRSIAVKRAALNNALSDQARFSSVLSKPENADVFAVSAFLNELVARRSVSWIRVFKDLRTVMPNNMRLMGIRLPQVPSEDASGVNHVQLDMLLATDSPTVIVSLLKRLQGSKMFGAAQMLAQQPPTQNDPLYKYRVRVAYEQKL